MRCEKAHNAWLNGSQPKEREERRVMKARSIDPASPITPIAMINLNRHAVTTDESGKEELSLETLAEINAGLLSDYSTIKVNPLTIKYVLPRIQPGSVGSLTTF